MLEQNVRSLTVHEHGRRCRLPETAGLSASMARAVDTEWMGRSKKTN